MSKRLVSTCGVSCAVVYGGIDVSAATLAVAVQPEGGGGGHGDGVVEQRELEQRELEQREFANTGAGHRQLIAWLRGWQAPVRVSMEATGIYSLDLAIHPSDEELSLGTPAMALDASEGIEVAVLNPKMAHRSWSAAGCRSWPGCGLRRRHWSCARSAATWLR